MPERQIDSVVPPLPEVSRDGNSPSRNGKRPDMPEYHKNAHVVGSFLRERREELDISQAAMSDHGGPAVSTVQNFESFKISTRPTSRTLSLFDTALKLPPGTTKHILDTGKIPDELPVTTDREQRHQFAVASIQSAVPDGPHTFDDVKAMKIGLLAQFLKLEEDDQRKAAVGEMLADIVLDVAETSEVVGET
jgi:transcriptional regulator with XRE-family HTH domain